MSTNVASEPMRVRLAPEDAARIPLVMVSGDDEVRCSVDLAGFIDEATDSLRRAGDDAELWCVQGASDGRCWLCGMFDGDEGWQFRACSLERPEELSTEYALDTTGDSGELIAELHSWFLRWSGDWLPRSAPPGSRLLRVRVHPAERWFLRVPLASFVGRRLARFERNSGCQWVVSQRALGEVAKAQARVDQTWRHVDAFLDGTRIFVNTYSRNDTANDHDLLRAGHSMLLQVFELLGTVGFPDRPRHLQWFLNAPPERVREALLDPACRYVLGNFEAASGHWETGDGPRRAWSDEILHGTCGVVDLQSLKGRLSHVDLIRVFHCHSFYNPFRPSRTPLTDAAIGSALLDSDALFIEGSLSSETGLRCLVAIMRLFIDEADLCHLVEMQCLVGAIDFNSLHQGIRAWLARVDEHISVARH